MTRRTLNPSTPRSRLTRAGLRACLGGALLASGAGAALHAQSSDPVRLEKLEKENQDLRQRLDNLELMAKKEGILPAEGTKTYALKALSEMSISGFVTASYFYDTSDPADGDIVGYLWNRNNNSFSLNKVKITLASPPVETDKWDAGYRVSLIFGEDAPIVNTGGELQSFEAVREAYVELNLPVGTGLNFKAGQLISLLNFESGDGGAVNPNFSQGNQWFFTGNGPAAGVQLGYAFNEMFDLRVRVQNGLFTGPVDNNKPKTLMGSLGIKPDSKTSINVIGFGGTEGADLNLWLKGGSVIASRLITEKYNLNFATEFDYFNQDTVGGHSEWWSIGGWLWADFTPVIGAAFRIDYINDSDGAGTSGLLGFPANTGQDLTSVTFTVNLRPAPNIKIQPEIRYDHTSLDGAFGGDDSRVVLGMGVSYLF